MEMLKAYENNTHIINNAHNAYNTNNTNNASGSSLNNAGNTNINYQYSLYNQDSRSDNLSAYQEASIRNRYNLNRDIPRGDNLNNRDSKR